MTIGICAEYRWNARERRVVFVPDSVRRLTQHGFSVIIEQGAGAHALFPDTLYAEAGATIAANAAEVIARCEILCTCTFPTTIADQLRSGQLLITLVQRWKHEQPVASVLARGVHILALENIPRITRAQAMDVLSSMATVAGYRAVLLAAERLPRFFPMLVSAAGTIPPANCLVIGAGVAGLQAIATARRLGAQVYAYDVRPAAQEQIASLGARPITIDLGTSDTETASGYARELADAQRRRQQEGLVPFVAKADVVITTAAVPGKRAPVLISKDMLNSMKAGSLVVDLAADSGGNTELTAPDTEVTLANGVTVIAPSLLAADLPQHASLMFSRNLTNLLLSFTPGESIAVHTNDEIVKAMLLRA